MRPADSALIAALKTGERQLAQQTRLGGKDMSAQVQSWSLEQSYGTDLPDAMRAFSGSSSASLSLTLAGTDTTSAPALYGPWAPRSSGDAVRPGQSVVHRWGLGGSTIPGFRGSLRARSAQSGSDAVQVSALDGAERLRMPAQLPRPSGGIDSDTPFGASTNWVASPGWCVDHLLRNAGIHTCPPPRTGALLYASLHGGAAANVGYLKSLSGDWSQWTKTNAPWECAVQGSSAGTTKAEYAPLVRAVNRNHTDGFWYEVWIDNTGVTSGDRSIDLSLSWVPASLTPVYTTLRADFAAGTVTFFNGTNATPASNSSTTWTVSALTQQSGRWHFGMWLTFSSTGVPTVEGTVQYPNGSGLILLPGTIGSAVPAGTMGNVILRIGGMRVEALQVSQLAAKPATRDEIMQNGTWKKTATLDAPDIPLRVVPVISGSAWEAITSIARATLSTAEFDGDGIFRWRSRSRWSTAPSAENLTVTSERELASLTITEEIDACRNHCSVKWANWSKVKANKSWTKAAANVVQIPAGGSFSIAWSIGDDELDTPPPFTYTDALPDCIRFVNANTDTAAMVYGAVEVGTRRENGTLVLSMRNRSASAVWLRGATSGGASVVLLTPGIDSGQAPADNWSAAWNTTSQQVYGVQAFEHDPGGWVQDSASAASLATALRTAGAYPYPLLGNVEILPDPRLQLGDVVRVVDTTGAALNTLAWVIGIRTAGEGTTVRQTLTLRATAYNGVPVDAGLTPDPPVDPAVTV